MNVDQKRMEVLSNNLANINSTGYKKRTASFVSYQDMLINALNKNSCLGSVSKGLIIQNFSIDLSGGSLQVTRNPLDLYVDGNNFFMVQDKSGNNLLTKNGSFGIDNENYLVNKDGYKVLGESGYINIFDHESLMVDSQGNITVDDRLVNKLKIASVNDSQDLEIANSSYYMLKGDVQVSSEKDVMIRQGFLETSNVNGISEMVEMISVMRSYEMNQKIIKMQDETLSKAVNNVGKLSI